MSDELLEEPEEDVYETWLARLPVKKRKRIRGQNLSLKTGLAAVAPLTCSGPSKCPFIAHCPIPERNPGHEPILGPDTDYPLFDDCVMERLYLRAKVQEYQTYLQVEDDNPIEISIVNDLALIDLYKNRATMLLSSGDRDGDGVDFMRVDVMERADNGTAAATSTTIHPAVEIIDRLEKRRERLVDRLMETRKGKLEVQTRLGIGSESNKVLEELRAVREMLSTQSAGLMILDEEEIKIT